jgi:hypothetical protein
MERRRGIAVIAHSAVIAIRFRRYVDVLCENLAVIGNIIDDGTYWFPTPKALNDITGFGFHLGIDMYGEQLKAMTCLPATIVDTPR